MTEDTLQSEDEIRLERARAIANSVPTREDVRRTARNDIRFLERQLLYQNALKANPAPPPDHRDYFKPTDYAKLHHEYRHYADPTLHWEIVDKLPVAQWDSPPSGEKENVIPKNPKLDAIVTRFGRAAAAGDQAEIQWMLDEAKRADRGETTLFKDVLQWSAGAPVPAGFEHMLYQSSAAREAYRNGHSETVDTLMQGWSALYPKEKKPSRREMFFWGEKEEYSPFGSHRYSAAALRTNLASLKHVFTDDAGKFDEAGYYNKLAQIVTRGGYNHSSYSVIHEAIDSRWNDEQTSRELFDCWYGVLQELDAYKKLTGKESHCYRALAATVKRSVDFTNTVEVNDALGIAFSGARYSIVDTILDTLKPTMTEEELTTCLRQAIVYSADRSIFRKMKDAAHIRNFVHGLERYFDATEIKDIMHEILSQKRSHYNHHYPPLQSFLLPSDEENAPEAVADYSVLETCRPYFKLDELMEFMVGTPRGQRHNSLAYDSWSIMALSERNAAFLDRHLQQVVAFAKRHKGELAETPEIYRERLIANYLDGLLGNFYSTTAAENVNWVLDQLDTLPKEKADEILFNVVKSNGLFWFHYIHGRGEHALSCRIRQRIEQLPNFKELEELLLVPDVDRLRPYDEWKDDAKHQNPRLPIDVLRNEHGLTLWHTMFDEFTEHWDNGGNLDVRGREVGFLKCLNLMKQYRLTDEQEDKLRNALGLPPASDGFDHRVDWKFVSKNMYERVMQHVPPGMARAIDRYNMTDAEIEAHFGKQALDVWPEAPHPSLKRYLPLDSEQMETYRRLLPVMEEIVDRERNGEAPVQAYKLAYMFDHFNRATKYVAQNADDSDRPVHNVMLYEPPRHPPSDDSWQKDIWAQRMVKYGPAFGRLLQRAVEIEQVVRDRIRTEKPDISPQKELKLLREKLKNMTPAELKEIARLAVYDHTNGAYVDPEVAEYLMNVGVDQIGYERTAEIISASIDQMEHYGKVDQTPEITVQGETIKRADGKPCDGYAMEKVRTVGEKDRATQEKNIARCLWVGFEVNCCNHLDGETRNLAMAQAVSPTTSLYIITRTDPKDGSKRVVAKVSGWLDKKSEIFVFNSWERLSPAYDPLMEPFLKEAATQIMRECPGIREVRIGSPRGDMKAYPLAASTVTPADSMASANDSANVQYTIMDRAAYELMAKHPNAGKGHAAKYKKRDRLVPDGTSVGRADS